MHNQDFANYNGGTKYITGQILQRGGYNLTDKIIMQEPAQALHIDMSMPFRVCDVTCAVHVHAHADWR
jgi:hypothetical protein